MKRREFITLLGGAAAAWPVVAHAQQSGRMRRIGFISAMAEKDPQGQLNVLAFQKGLLERGLNVGQNLRIDYRFGAVGVETIRTAVSDILATSPEVILAHGTAVTAILKKQTETVPVVFTVVSDPVGSGFIESFARPGGNLTGFTNFHEPSMGAKWVELLKEIAPGVSRVGILFNPHLAPGGGMYLTQPVETSAASLGVKTVRLPVQSSADIDQAINAPPRLEFDLISILSGLGRSGPLLLFRVPRPT
jgi:ABC-type uncharacterized transport system substrate-binding protein